MKLSFLIFLSFQTTLLWAANVPVYINTKVGRFKGTQYDYLNTTIQEFKGIRFGQPPLVVLRFAKPIPADPLPNITLDATKYGPICTQYLDPGEWITSEDCLFLNIWTTKSKKKPQLKPVMFWIYGGGQISGTSSIDIYEGRTIAALGDVVVVTHNYRIGTFGFLYGGRPDSPGNLGLYDQLLALKWVRDNIESFSGDPGQITIFGESAGAFSVGALILSPLAQGLFKRAIAESGSPNFEYTVRSVQWATNQTLTIARKVNCLPEEEPDSITKEVFDCIRQKDAKELIYLAGAIGDSVMVYYTEFLPYRPAFALKHGLFNKVDYLFGVVDSEGSTFTQTFVGDEGQRDFDPHQQCTMTLNKTKYYLKKVMNEVNLFDDIAIDAIIDFYTFGLKDGDGDKLRKAVSKAVGDAGFVCPMALFGEHLATWSRHRNIYSYRFTYIAETYELLYNCVGWMGVCHGADVPHVFGLPVDNYPLPIFWTEEERVFSRQIVEAWTHFAKTGEIRQIGGVEWRPATDTRAIDPSIQYMQLYPANYAMVDGRYRDNCDRLFRKYLDNPL